MKSLADKRTADFTIALAGNANVGKSVIFNQLTSGSQMVGNWPGKTVEAAWGILVHERRKINIVDLPGIYSTSTFSQEEIVSRDYILDERPDVIINVVDASTLERNLYFTLQLLELGRPVVLALNQIDIAKRAGIGINANALSKELGIPVIPTIATTGIGVHKLVDRSLRWNKPPRPPRYGKEVEERIQALERILERDARTICKSLPVRLLAVKLLEHDESVEKKMRTLSKRHDPKALESVFSAAARMRAELRKMHGEDSRLVMISERYALAQRIALAATRMAANARRENISETFDRLAMHKQFGFAILAIVLLGVFAAVFAVGSYLNGLLEPLLEQFIGWFRALLAQTALSPVIAGLLVGIVSGIVAGITIALPYIVPFHIIVSILEDTGYLARMAFLTDGLMHRIGLHGKAFLPLFLGYGCSVPACMGCRIMERDRERFMTAMLVVLIPCAARTVVILGLVGKYIGTVTALGIYLFDIILVFAVGKLLSRFTPGEPVGLIMEVPSYKRPLIRNVIKKSWLKTRDFLTIAMPLIVVGSGILECLKSTGMLSNVNAILTPITVGILGLPAIVGSVLIFGILRKELTLILLAEVTGTANFQTILNPVQMVAFAVFVTIYVPCIATIAAARKEFGWKKVLFLMAFTTVLALLSGWLARVLIPMVL